MGRSRRWQSGPNKLAELHPGVLRRSGRQKEVGGDATLNRDGATNGRFGGRALPRAAIISRGRRAAGSCGRDRKSTRLNSSHGYISYAVFCLKKKKKTHNTYVAISTEQCRSDITQ